MREAQSTKVASESYQKARHPFSIYPPQHFLERRKQFFWLELLLELVWRGRLIFQNLSKEGHLLPLLLGSISAFKEQSRVSWQHTSYPLGPVMKESTTRRNYDCYQFGKVLLTNWGLVRWSAGMERDKPDDTVDRKLPGGTKTKWKKQIRNEREIPSCPQTSFFNYPDSNSFNSEARAKLKLSVL